MLLDLLKMYEKGKPSRVFLKKEKRRPYTKLFESFLYFEQEQATQGTEIFFIH